MCFVIFKYYARYYTCKTVEIICGQGWYLLFPERISMYIYQEWTSNIESSYSKFRIQRIKKCSAKNGRIFLDSVYFLFILTARMQFFRVPPHSKGITQCLSTLLSWILGRLELPIPLMAEGLVKTLLSLLTPSSRIRTWPPGRSTKDYVYHPEFLSSLRPWLCNVFLFYWLMYGLGTKFSLLNTSSLCSM